jgi:hypothetical protein
LFVCIFRICFFLSVAHRLSDKFPAEFFLFAVLFGLNFSVPWITLKLETISGCSVTNGQVVLLVGIFRSFYGHPVFQIIRKKIVCHRSYVGPRQWSVTLISFCFCLTDWLQIMKLSMLGQLCSFVNKLTTLFLKMSLDVIIEQKFYYCSKAKKTIFFF